MNEEEENLPKPEWIPQRMTLGDLVYRTGQRLFNNIVNRVATVLLPDRKLWLMHVESRRGCSLISRTLRMGSTWADCFVMDIVLGVDETILQLTMHLDNPFSDKAIFVLTDQETHVVLFKLVATHKAVPMNSLQFLAAKTLVNVWDTFDEASQRHICEYTLPKSPSQFCLFQ